MHFSPGVCPGDPLQVTPPSTRGRTGSRNTAKRAADILSAQGPQEESDFKVGGGRCRALRLLSVYLLESAWKPQAQKGPAFLDVRATCPAALSPPQCGRALTMRNRCGIQAVPIHQKRVGRLLLTSTF